MATSIVIIEKSGELKELNVKNFDIKDLYKKCNFRKSDGFDERHYFKNININGENFNIAVFAKIDGKANTENKYDMPPPIDTTLFFGNMGLIRYADNKKIINLKLDDWNKIYNKLFGGFEDLSKFDQEDEYESDELENIPSNKKTKNGGYLKDGFVVDSNSEDNISDSNNDDEKENDESEEEEEEEEESDNNEISDNNSDNISELQEEEYVFSDEEN